MVARRVEARENMMRRVVALTLFTVTTAKNGYIYLSRVLLTPGESEMAVL